MNEPPYTNTHQSDQSHCADRTPVSPTLYNHTEEKGDIGTCQLPNETGGERDDGSPSTDIENTVEKENLEESVNDESAYENHPKDMYLLLKKRDMYALDPAAHETEKKNIIGYT